MFTGVFTYENLRRHYQSKGHPINYGICLQNAFPICGGCGIIKSRTGDKKVSVPLHAHLKRKNSYDQEDYQGGTAFLIGNEGNGLTEEAAEAADCLIRIPMCGKVESLNAAMAAGILMYEAARQRR